MEQSIDKLIAALEGIRKVRSESDKSLPSTVDALIPFVSEIRSVVAKELEPILKKYSGLKLETIEEKHTAANAVSALLDLTGLSIKCPRTGQPSRLIARSGSAARNGHFQIEHRGSHTFVSKSSVAFPDVELILSEVDGKIHYKNGSYTGRGR